jgi:hypothetical protein
MPKVTQEFYSDFKYIVKKESYLFSMNMSKISFFFSYTFLYLSKVFNFCVF